MDKYLATLAKLEELRDYYKKIDFPILSSVMSDAATAIKELVDKLKAVEDIPVKVDDK